MYIKVTLQYKPSTKVFVDEITDRDADGYSSSIYSYCDQGSKRSGIFAIRESKDAAIKVIKSYHDKKVKELLKELDGLNRISKQLEI